MRIVVVVATVASLLLVGFVISIIAPPRHHPMLPYQPIAADLLPGNPLPRHSLCKPNHYSPSENVAMCHIYSQGAVEISILYSLDLKCITDVWMEVSNETIGDLVLAWDTPMGYSTDNTNWSIYWPGRYAYVVDNSFEPLSMVGFIAYSMDRPTYQSWRGFVTR